MGELMFCLKTLVAAVVIVLAMQVRVGKSTLERHAQNWLETSPIANYLQTVAQGAALATKNATKSLGQMTSQAFSGGNSDSPKASRLNIDLQRSPAVSPKKAKPDLKE